MFIKFPEIQDLIVEGLDNIRLPKMVRIEQKYDSSYIEDIPVHILRQMRECDRRNDFDYKDKSICITAGSRGIPHIDIIIKTICDELKARGARPFIVPAMGSHGGATAEGQAEVLKKYHITEETVGAPVRSSMEVVQYGTMSNGIPLYCDKLAMESDGVILLHKVKPHTDFRSEHESGLLKMILIGLANHIGPSMIHTCGFGSFGQMLLEAGETFLNTVPVPFAVGIVQNAYDNISRIEIVPSDEIIQTDKELLAEAKKQIAHFKFDSVNVMVIDEIGKEISGYGFDPNVIGRSNSIRYGVTNPIEIERMVILGLTEGSCHNGSGIVAADVTTRECLNQVDWTDTWINLITSTEIQGTKIPMYSNSDREAIMMAIRCCRNPEPDKIRIARIKNTLCMEEIMVSEALYESIKGRDDVIKKSDPFSLEFDADGKLING